VWGLSALYAILVAIAYLVGRRLRRQVRLTTYVAEHDLLTDLPNRRLFERRAESAIRRGERRGRATTVAVLDLDRFKEVNDTLGHRNGDRLLEELSRTLRAELADPELLARLDGDAFGLVLEGEGDPAGLLERLRRALEEEVAVAGIPLSIESSIGFSVSRRDGSTLEGLLAQAETAMYAAKERHLGVVGYERGLDRYDAANLALVADLRRGIDHDELVVHYQPQVAVEDGRVEVLEALVRWNHPTQGLLMPDRFVPLAEQTDLIERQTIWVLRRALGDLARRDLGGADLAVAVNVSARSLAKPDFVRQVVGALSDAMVASKRLVIEVTETALMTDPVCEAATLAELGTLGVRVSIDDFGAGQTSLAYLATLPVAELKIDRGFVSDLTRRASHRAIVDWIVDLGHNLGLRVVAEGVEDAETLEALADSGCDVAQGYLISRPMPVGDVARWLRRRQVVSVS
jgi:diguanylate cyclase (GGDEF)-like protein